MIEHLENFPDNVVAFRCHGRVTRDDYTKTLEPIVESALKRHGKVRLYYEVGSGFTGVDASAMWEDTKVGMAHLLSWERIALVSDVEWMRHTASFFGFLMPATVKVFPTAQAAEARAWIIAD